MYECLLLIHYIAITCGDRRFSFGPRFESKIHSPEVREYFETLGLDVSWHRKALSFTASEAKMTQDIL